MSYSIRNEWGTPRWLFDAVVERYGIFDLDAAANADNALADRFWTREDDALTKPWCGHVWCNPPFSGDRPLVDWVQWAVWQAEQQGAVIDMLLRGDWGTKAFRWAVGNAHDIWMVSPRIEFEPPPGVQSNSGVQGPSFIIHFDPAFIGLDRARIELWDLSDRVPKKGRKP